MSFLEDMLVKSSAVAKEINRMVVGQPVYTDKKYDKMVEAGHNNNIWVYRCVSVTARAVASIPLEVYNGDDDEKVAISNHPIQQLINAPNEEESRNDFFEKWAAFLLLSGNAYVELNGTSDKKPPQEMFIWRPDRTMLVPGEEGIERVRYAINGGYVDMPYERMIHTKYFHPTDDYYGLSPLQVAMRTIDTDNATNDWNNALINNYAAPGGVFKVPQDTRLNEAQLHRITKVIRRMFGGGQNAGKTHLLEGGIEWQQLGLSPKDMDFIDSRKMSREEICAVFGVPPQMVGIQDNSTYNNYREARQSFYEDTVLPLVDKIASSINHKLVPLVDERVIVGYDKSKIEALQESADAKSERMAQNKDMLTVNERRIALGYDAIPTGDVLIIPDNVTLVNVDEIEVNEEENEDEQVDELKVFDDLKRKLEHKALADDFNNSVDTMASKFNKVIADVFEKEYKAIKKRIESSDNVIDINYLDLQAEVDKLHDEWLAVFVAINKYGSETFFKSERNRLIKKAGALQTKEDELYEEITLYMQEWILDQAADQVTYVTDTTKERLKELFFQASDEAWTMTDYANAIHHLYTDVFPKDRAHMIARTEMMAAASYGKQQGARSTGLPMDKIWNSTGDERTRTSHRLINGQRVDMNDYYTVNSYKAMHPGDSMLPAGERIRCRCVETYDVRLNDLSQDS